MTGIAIQKQLTREGILRVVAEECSETIQAADILDDDRSRVLVRMVVAVLWGNIQRRTTLIDTDRNAALLAEGLK